MDVRSLQLSAYGERKLGALMSAFSKEFSQAVNAPKGEKRSLHVTNCRTIIQEMAKNRRQHTIAVLSDAVLLEICARKPLFG